ncbi:MAG TPA: glycine/sarcosine/betaine reductase selenoprotein B family protein [Thermodesulfovibrionia bacterium]|nr:glycine/sarcosine/betaine reductase selenoprotein B family protein [Thermodesulfovibrionia bacterium]
MTILLRLKNRVIAKVITRFPSLSKKFTDAYAPLESKGIPWTPFNNELRACKVGLVTTAGVHHRSQKPFNMADKNGDPSYRSIDSRKPLNDLIITHDYYDHTDADRDINIVFPIERLREFEAEGIIGEVSKFNYAFMGHIDGPHIQTLINETGPEVALCLKEQAVEVALLTPG